MAKRRSTGPHLGKIVGDILRTMFKALAKSQRQRKSTKQVPRQTTRSPVGEFDLEVVGESSYRQNIRALFGAGEGRKYFPAELLPEPDNPHDKNAVKVVISGKTVGYLSRETAKIYARKHGNRPATINAVVVSRNGGHGIWLDFTL